MSNTRWLANVAMLVPIEHRENACLAAAQFTGNPADNTPEFWSVPVYDSNDDLKYYMAHSRIRGHVLQYFPALQIQYPGSLYILTSHDDYPENTYMTVNQWLTSLGLHLDEQPDLIDAV